MKHRHMAVLIGSARVLALQSGLAFAEFSAEVLAKLADSCPDPVHVPQMIFQRHNNA